MSTTLAGWLLVVVAANGVASFEKFPNEDQCKSAQSAVAVINLDRMAGSRGTIGTATECVKLEETKAPIASATK